MGAGDIMLLFTDGFQDQEEGAFNFISEGLENCLREVKQSSAKEIVKFIIKNFFSRVPEPDDDVTIVVVKKN